MGSKEHDLPQSMSPGRSAFLRCSRGSDAPRCSKGDRPSSDTHIGTVKILFTVRKDLKA